MQPRKGKCNSQWKSQGLGCIPVVRIDVHNIKWFLLTSLQINENNSTKNNGSYQLLSACSVQYSLLSVLSTLALLALLLNAVSGFYSFFFFFLFWTRALMVRELGNFFSFLNEFFNWGIIALQNFAVFCQTSAWVSHRHTYVPSLLKLLPVSLPTPPLYVGTEPLSELPETYVKFPLAIYFTYGNISFHVILSIHLTLSSPLMSISLFLHCFPVNFFSTIFLESIYMH